MDDKTILPFSKDKTITNFATCIRIVRLTMLYDDCESSGSVIIQIKQMTVSLRQSTKILDYTPEIQYNVT